jgi:peptidoglycan/xylan/chitin deacetylase (PgdA/CDA1 family)
MLRSAAMTADKWIAVTIDDLPFASPACSPDTRLPLARRALRTLHSSGIRCIGFVIGSHIANQGDIEIIDAFANANHVIANHGWRHIPFTSLTLVEFEYELLCAHRALARWMGDSRFFRYPLLRMGQSRRRQEESLRILRLHGYTHIPATIAPEDWIFDEEFHHAGEAILTGYVQHCVHTAEKAYEVARTKIGRPVPHILVIHMNALNSIGLEYLIEALRANDWLFIDPLVAFQDPIYYIPSAYFGTVGVPWLDHIKSMEQS